MRRCIILQLPSITLKCSQVVVSDLVLGSGLHGLPPILAPRCRLRGPIHVGVPGGSERRGRDRERMTGFMLRTQRSPVTKRWKVVSCFRWWQHVAATRAMGELVLASCWKEEQHDQNAAAACKLSHGQWISTAGFVATFAQQAYIQTRPSSLSLEHGFHA